MSEETENVTYIPTGSREVKIVYPPYRAPLDAIPEPGAVGRAMGVLKWLRNLHAEHPDKHFAEFKHELGNAVANAVIDLWAAGLVTVIVWKDKETGEYGSAVSALNIVQVSTPPAGEGADHE